MMVPSWSSTQTCLAISLLSSLTLAAPTSQGAGFQVKPLRRDNYWVPGSNDVAYAVLELELQPDLIKSRGIIPALRNGFQINGFFGQYGESELTSTEGGLVFTTSLTVGQDTFQVVVDTGSSDTWLVGTGFQCLGVGTGDVKSQDACEFGPTYSPDNTFKAIPDENFRIDYSDGETLTGTFGTETVTVAGITVPNQQIAVVNRAAYNGDGMTSGLLGLAFPANTRAYSGNDPNTDSLQSQKIYNPVFTNMYTNSNIPPLFSIALDRNTNGGSLALGGLPPVAHDFGWASSPLQVLMASNSDKTTGSSSAYTLYTITTEGFAYENSSPNQWANSTNPNPRPNDPTQVQMIIDSGTTIISLPQTAADAVNNLFDPKPFYKDSAGYYIIPCSATPPLFGVRIGSQTFQINPKDMIINEGGRCVSGVGATASGGINVLGHAFLKNVVAVFDVGASMMRFAARENY